MHTRNKIKTYSKKKKIFYILEKVVGESVTVVHKILFFNPMACIVSSLV